MMFFGQYANGNAPCHARGVRFLGESPPFDQCPKGGPPPKPSIPLQMHFLEGTCPAPEKQKPLWRGCVLKQVAVAATVAEARGRKSSPGLFHVVTARLREG